MVVAVAVAAVVVAVVAAAAVVTVAARGGGDGHRHHHRHHRTPVFASMFVEGYVLQICSYLGPQGVPRHDSEYILHEVK